MITIPFVASPRGVRCECFHKRSAARAAALFAAFVLAVTAIGPASLVAPSPAAAQGGFEGYSSSGRSAGASGNQPSISSQVKPPVLKDVEIEQKINQPIPSGLRFLDETGRNVVLDDYFGKKPVILAFVYYTCPMLCSQVMEGLTSSLKAVSFRPGQEFDVVVVSIDPNDTPQRAATKKHSVVARYGHEETDGGWHFLTGTQEEIQKLADAAGYHYTWDASGKQFAHASGIIVVNPERKFYRYFYGVNYPPKDVRLALVEAGQRKVGTVIDQVLLFCYHYDPAQGRYTALTLGVLRGAAVVTILVLGGVIFLMLRSERRKGPAAGGAHP